MATEEDQIEILKHIFIGIGVWFGVLKAILVKVSNRKIAISAIIASIGGLFVTDVLGFAYVQAVIVVANASTQFTLPKEEKEFVYAANALIAVPISIIPWIESTACQTIASKVGGHLIYDVAIVTLLTAAYYASWRHYIALEKVKEA